VEYEIVLVNAQIYGPAIFELHGQGRPALDHTNIALIERNTEFLGFCEDIGSNRVSSFLRGRRKFNFLPDEIVELERSEISRTVLGRSVQESDERQQEEQLPAVQAKHGADYNIA
jgi:hypothetical protein